MSVVTFLIAGQKYNARPSLSALREYGNIIGTNKINEVIKSLAFDNPDELSFDDIEKIAKLIMAGIKVEGSECPKESDIFDNLIKNMDKATDFMNLIMDSFTTQDEKKNVKQAKPKAAI